MQSNNKEFSSIMLVFTKQREWRALKASGEEREGEGTNGYPEVTAMMDLGNFTPHF